jgi:uncharacterized protein (DUF2126 family)/transglutaminase-like putative cysteine protease
MRVTLHHRTHYEYDRPVVLAPQLVRLRPAPHCRTPVQSYSLQSDPAAAITWHQDPLGSFQARLAFDQPADSLRIDVNLVVDLVPINPFDFVIDDGADRFPFRYAPSLRTRLQPYCARGRSGPRLRSLVNEARARHTDQTIQYLVDLNQWVHERIAYLRRDEPGVRDCEETLRLASGSCRDSAWLMVQLLRHLGLAARFVSGYLVQLAPDVPEDTLDLHAWAEVFLPGAGWLGLDATSGLLAAEQHIPLACAPLPADAAPLDGRFTWKDEPRPRQQLHTHMQLTRCAPASRHHQDYSDKQWARIDAVGQAVDEALQRGDVQLTMGGEPTFVSLEHAADAQWQTLALGEEKFRLGEVLVWRLQERFTTGGLVTFGQGKWYPGEPLPRWIFRCVWRRDEVPIWTRPELLDRVGGSAPEVPDSPIQPFEPRRFARALARELGVNSRHVLTVGDGTGSSPRIEGAVLPLGALEGVWQSQPWRLPQPLELVPGDSPLGLRLPLYALPADVEVRTALCIEVRDGRQYVFIPPLPALDDWLALVAAIEAVTARLRTRVVIEGYAPPCDERLQVLSVTPDPGVLEVNVHPASSWRELCDLQNVVYEEAHKARLVAEKFWYDGRRLGTGGGHHIVLGGITPQASPLLRRPKLLCTLLTYFNRHPSLSYLFSSLFVGPTSQAPRVDEARYDSLYELELAFAEVAAQPDMPPALIDRVFRNLLVDLTGNTHRAEFCVDKLYSPDLPEGARGLLELRSFEMQPQPRQQLALLLLLRGIVAMLWHRPYERSLVRWGTQLHDRFMLPSFLWDDLRHVIAGLRSAGFDFERSWYEPHFELRCPLLARLSVEGGTLELRQAIEPWPVLGEEMGSGGVVRAVDSSMNRLEVRTVGLPPSRFSIGCNGVEVPLHALDDEGVMVGGVRFRAAKYASSLHPTIDIHAPLTFDIVDSFTGRSVGGCIYHVNAPDGSLYAELPAHAEEAAARRAARVIKKSGGALLELRKVTPHASYPLTLDLRTC